MKNLLLISKKKEIHDLYYRELKFIFNKHIHIFPYAETPFDGTPLDTDMLEKADLIVITNPYSFPLARSRMKPDAKIIHLNFTFSKEAISRLQELPVGTEALVCFNFYSSAHQAATALYEYGLQNLNLYINYPNNQNLINKKMDIAIISQDASSVPDDITSIIDLGPRKLSLSTILDIAVKAGILDETLEVKINEYISNIMISDDYMTYFLNSSSTARAQLKYMSEVMRLESALRKEMSKKGHIAKYHFEDMLGESPLFLECLNKAKKIAGIDKPTLIIGESGTGKELFAQSIHNASPRKRFPFVAMNCAAIPATLLESELFGYEEGSFTGAKKGGKTGLFQMAHKGTLFLDEIGDMSLPTQAKLLRVLEEKEIMKLGSGEIIKVDVRIIAATNRDLNQLVEEGSFRLDLYYRLNTLIIQIPPLRKRISDILILIKNFLAQENMEYITFDKSVISFLLHYEWKGNIRELKNCVDYAANISDGHVMMKHLPDYIHTNYDSCFSKKNTMQDQIYQWNSHDKTIIINVLSLIKNNNIGRRVILSSLIENGITISEYKLRILLKQLSIQNYVYFGKGRKGCTITKDGENLLTLLRLNLPIESPETPSASI
ncbi:MAG: sigma 54-interacting transcriptional regulator [Anaerovorax sp.]|nr:sigma 54-interacting transcriptional regulator [Anaerovorax sp.]